MKQSIQRVITGACAIGVTLSLGLVAAPAIAADDDYEVLVVGETLGFRHSHIDDTTRAIIALGEENGFSVDVWDPPQGSSPGQPALTLPSSPRSRATSAAAEATWVCMPRPTRCTRCPGTAS